MKKIVIILLIGLISKSGISQKINTNQNNSKNSELSRNNPYFSLRHDTIVYRGFLNGIILYETIELYPNKTFKWTSEYDLSWDEYGVYEMDHNNLQLKYYLLHHRPITMTLKDTIVQLDNPIKSENFKMKKERLFRLNKLGRKIHRIKDKSIRTCCSWIFGHKYKLIKILN